MEERGSEEQKETRRQQCKELVSSFLFHFYHQDIDEPVDFFTNDREVIKRRLQSMIENFFNHRDEDCCEPNAFGSTFLHDVTILAANTSRRGKLFSGDARHIAISVTERLLRAKGWEPKPSAEFGWKEDVFSWNPQPADGHQTLKTIILRHWEYDEAPDDQAFEDCVDWVAAQKWGSWILS